MMDRRVRAVRWLVMLALAMWALVAGVLPAAKVAGTTATQATPPVNRVAVVVADGIDASPLRFQVEASVKSRTTSLTVYAFADDVWEEAGHVLVPITYGLTFHSCSVGKSREVSYGELNARQKAALDSVYAAAFSGAQRVQLVSFAAGRGASLRCDIAGTWTEEVGIGAANWSVPAFEIVGSQHAYQSTQLQAMEKLYMDGDYVLDSYVPAPGRADAVLAQWEYNEDAIGEQLHGGGYLAQPLWYAEVRGVSATLSSTIARSQVQRDLFFAGVYLGVLTSVVVWLVAELFEFFQTERGSALPPDLASTLAQRNMNSEPNVLDDPEPDTAGLPETLEEPRASQVLQERQTPRPPDASQAPESPESEDDPDGQLLG